MNRGYHKLKALEGAMVDAVNTLAQAIAAERHAIQAFTGRGFWSRLNWLLTGR